jgi:hypothetical protein
MAETGITNMPARLQEDEFCANSLFGIGMDGENIVWNVYRFECSKRRRRSKNIDPVRIFLLLKTNIVLHLRLAYL